MVWALLPVKDLVKAKSRLGGVLAPHERRALAQAMVEDVLSALVAVDELDGILMISDDPAAELLAHKYGIDVVTEASLDCTGLNAVVAAGRELLHERGVTDMLILHSDIPLLRPRQIRELLAQYRESGADVLLVPDLVGDGTNLMLCRTWQPPAFRYGPGSCRAHRASAADRDLQLVVVRDDSIGLDIDEPSDLIQLFETLQGADARGHTAQLLLETAIAQRLALVRQNMDSDAEPGQHDAI